MPRPAAAACPEVSRMIVQRRSMSRPCRTADVDGRSPADASLLSSEVDNRDSCRSCSALSSAHAWKTTIPLHSTKRSGSTRMVLHGTLPCLAVALITEPQVAMDRD